MKRPILRQLLPHVHNPQNPKPSTKKWNGSAWSNYGYSEKDAEGMFLVVKKPIIDWYDEWKRSSVPKSRAIQEYMAFYLDHWR